jgi:uncharacterized ferritin-like protein (DUF455 family)
VGRHPRDALRLRPAAPQEEISHCAKGVRWFRRLTRRSRGVGADAGDAPGDDEGDVAAAFHAAVRAHFTGNLKPPFNEAARAAAGFAPAWYLPLVAKAAAPAPAAAPQLMSDD